MRVIITIISAILFLCYDQISYAQETTLVVGMPGERPQDSLKGVTISTAQIDQQIANLGSALNLQFGSHFTRNLANEAFEDIDDFRISMVNELRAELVSERAIRSVPILDINVDPLNVRLLQTQTNLAAEIGNFSLNSRLRVNTNRAIGGFKGSLAGFFCGTATITLDVDQIMIKSSYNLYTGQIIDSEVDLNVKRVDANCNRLPGSLLINAFKGLLDEEKLAERKILEAANRDLSMTQIGGLFSIRDLIDGLKTYCDTIGQIPFVGADAQGAFQQAVNLAEDTLTSSTFQGSGIQIDFTFSKSRLNNLIKLTASHNQPSVEIRSQTSGWVQLEVDQKFNSKNMVAYARVHPTWTAITSVVPNSDIIFGGQYPDNTALTAVTESRLISGLYSFPASFVKTEVQPGCLSIICEDPNSPGGIGF